MRLASLVAILDRPKTTKGFKVLIYWLSFFFFLSSVLMFGTNFFVRGLDAFGLIYIAFWFLIGVFFRKAYNEFDGRRHHALLLSRIAICLFIALIVIGYTYAFYSERRIAALDIFPELVFFVVFISFTWRAITRIEFLAHEDA